ncbi:MAG TPA: hypothetical protein VFR47_14125 [Anaerolineales bacterium]|nr:hypothetical protein [Anaerolineales bacterium]
MFILITVSILFVTALALITLRFTLGEYRYSWLIATSGSFFAWISVFVWQLDMPFQIQLPSWQPIELFPASPFLVADDIAWAFALSLASMCLAVILTAVIRDNFPYPLSWIGVVILTALGILAVTADNPLTLVLLWPAIDIAELIAHLRIVQQPQLSERVVITFAARVMGILILLWANMVSLSNGVVLDFRAAPPQVGLYLILAVGLRLGVLPLHLPYTSESAIRRGFGTGLRMISAASSLILLSRIPASSLASPFTPYLMVLIALAGLYAAWMWLRAPDELTGRPYWMIGMGSLALAAALRANPVGAAAWSIALVLAGGALFLTSAQTRWLERALLVGVWSISSLPFSLTATGWVSHGLSFWYALPVLLATHAMLIAGLVRHVQRSSTRAVFDTQTSWARNVYPIGVLIILLTMLGLSLFGWDGSLQIGSWLLGLSASLLALAFIWLTPRLRVLNPVRAHWVRPANPAWLEWAYRTIWNGYYQISRLGNAFSELLEGESGIMWTLLFLALFISFFSQRTP